MAEEIHSTRFRHKGSEFNYISLQMQMLHCIDSMRYGEQFYLLAAFQVPADEWKKLHHEAASSGRLRAAEVMSILHSIRKVDDRLYTVGLRTVLDRLHQHLKNYVIQHQIIKTAS